jgi:hypothetical protein
MGQVLELDNGKVCCERRLHTFLSDDSNTDISDLNHGDVISSVTDACNPLIGVLLYFPSDDRLLSRTAPADADRGCIFSNLEKGFLDFRVVKND